MATRSTESFAPCAGIFNAPVPSDSPDHPSCFFDAPFSPDLDHLGVLDVPDDVFDEPQSSADASAAAAWDALVAWPLIAPGFQAHRESVKASASQEGGEVIASPLDSPTVFEFDELATYFADEIDFDRPAPPDDTDPGPCRCGECEDCEVDNRLAGWDADDAADVDLTTPVDPWEEETEAAPFGLIYDAPYSATDAAWFRGYALGYAMTPASVPPGLNRPETIAWCEGNERGWRDGLADELARIDREEAEAEVNAAMADRYAMAEAEEAKQGGGHGYGPDADAAAAGGSEVEP